MSYAPDVAYRTLPETPQDQPVPREILDRAGHMDPAAHRAIEVLISRMNKLEEAVAQPPILQNLLTLETMVEELETHLGSRHQVLKDLIVTTFQDMQRHLDQDQGRILDRVEILEAQLRQLQATQMSPVSHPVHRAPMARMGLPGTKPRSRKR